MAAFELEHLPRTKESDIHPTSALNAVHKANSDQVAEDGLGSAPETTISQVAKPGDFVQTKAQAAKANLQLAALFMTLFLAGWNDGTTGPLLPRIQRVYNVSDTIVSLIFIFACLGFTAGSVLNIPLSVKWGFGKTIVLGSVLQVVAYALQSASLPFPAFVMAYVINGIGISVQDAQANGFVASLQKNTETKMGVLHAIYGVGAFAAPLVATQFAQLERWSFHFLVSVGLAVVNTVLLILVFKFKTQDECLKDIGQDVGEKNETGHGSFKQILSQRNVHLMAFFILVYVGVEVTIGGWIVTFVIRERNGGPDAGYISSGFFGGLALGRVALLWINKKLGERNAMFIYAALAIGLELIVWLVPSLIGGAVAVSFVGFLLGPMYPITMNHAGRTLPRWVLTGSIGWIAGFGQAGSAVFPFATGALAGKYGIRSLQPLLLAMMAAMTALWAVVGFSSKKRKD